jgi:hypothetical protein
MIVRPARQPCLDHWRLVGGIVVHHNMHVGAIGHVGVDLLEKVEKLGCPMPLVAFADDGSGGDVEGGKQRSRTVPDIAVGTPIGDARHHRQHGLLAVERLYLALLIDTQDQGMGRRRKIEADNRAF